MTRPIAFASNVKFRHNARLLVGFERPMAKEDQIEMEGEVVDTLPNICSESNWRMDIL